MCRQLLHVSLPVQIGRSFTMFIVVDGIDGAGKTTLVRQLSETLTSLEPVVTKEPTNKSEWGQNVERKRNKRQASQRRRNRVIS